MNNMSRGEMYRENALRNWIDDGENVERASTPPGSR